MRSLRTRAIGLALFLALPACHSMNDVPSSPSPSSAASSAAPASSTPEGPTATPSAAPAPALDLGPHFKRTTFTPGRYAGAVQKTNGAIHAAQVVREDLTSSFIATFAEDGSVKVCRGWRYFYSNNGPKVRSSENIREQLGYVGHYTVKESVLDVRLKLDDGVCARVGEYSHMVPNHATDWHLRCVAVAPEGHPSLSTPVLACQVLDLASGFGEDDPHLVEGIVPGKWILLGPGNGLRARVTAHSVSADSTPEVTVSASADAITESTWQKAF